VVAAAALQATEFVGLPECQLALAQAVTYIATAPKSNAATVAIGEARKDVREGRTLAVPDHLRDSHYPGAKRLGRGQGYQYSHDAPTGYVEQEYIPEKRQYYRPVDRGHEAVIRQWMAQLKEQANAQASGGLSSDTRFAMDPDKKVLPRREGDQGDGAP
jgi:putative ATPase